jgi:hypothetical protein
MRGSAVPSAIQRVARAAMGDAITVAVRTDIHTPRCRNTEDTAQILLLAVL